MSSVTRAVQESCQQYPPSHTDDIITTLYNGKAKPVALDSEYGTLVFPSIYTANIMGVSGMLLRNASCSERKYNNMNRDTAMKIIKSICQSDPSLS